MRKTLLETLKAHDDKMEALETDVANLAVTLARLVDELVDNHLLLSVDQPIITDAIEEVKRQKMLDSERKRNIELCFAGNDKVSKRIGTHVHQINKDFYDKIRVGF